jgi:threonylcarbamoyladenosine tRNA methylthiotransferase MtaB
MPQVPGAIVKERARRLIARGDAARRAHLARLRGASLSVLAEAGGLGRAEDFSLVKFRSPPPRGEIVTAMIESDDGERLIAA